LQPIDRGHRNVRLPYPNIAIGKIWRAEESQLEGTPIGDYDFRVADKFSGCEWCLWKSQTLNKSKIARQEELISGYFEQVP
jgi:hypothetical protein